MLEDIFFKHLAKEAIDKYPVISGDCDSCPIGDIEAMMSKHRSFFKENYLKENAKNNGSTCFLVAQKIQFLKIAKIPGIIFDKNNRGYIGCTGCIGCSNFFYDQNTKIEIIKTFNNFNKI